MYVGGWVEEKVLRAQLVTWDNVSDWDRAASETNNLECPHPNVCWADLIDLWENKIASFVSFFGKLSLFIGQSWKKLGCLVGLILKFKPIIGQFRCKSFSHYLSLSLFCCKQYDSPLHLARFPNPLLKLPFMTHPSLQSFSSSSHSRSTTYWSEHPMQISN